MLDQNRDLQLMFNRYWDKALKGHAYAMMYVADCFLYGWGTDVDMAQYKDCLKKAASMGVNKALKRLFYEALGINNSMEAENILTLWGKLFEEGKCGFINYHKKTAEIYNSLQEKTVQKMMEAFSKDVYPEEWACDEAICYQFGYGVEKNPVKVAEILVNHLGSQYDFPDEIANVLGLHDIGVITKEQVGEHLCELMYKVHILDTLDSIEKPNEYAGYRERLMIYAACVGNVSSQTMMAQLYLGGEIGYIHNNEYADDVEALRWLLISLRNGGDGEHHEVLPTLTLIAEELNEKCDYDNAFKAFNALAEYGYIPAYRIVGIYYFNGYGVERDYMQAGQWWLRAAQNNEEEAISIVNSIIEMGNGDYWAGLEAFTAQYYTNNGEVGSSNIESPGENETATSGGCYVATCVYGSYDCPEVWTLRRFRDYCLTKTWYGRLFIKLYYTISPIIVHIFGKYSFFKEFWRRPLDRMVYRLNAKGFKSTKYDDRNWS